MLLEKHVCNQMLWKEAGLKGKFFVALPDFFHKLSRPLHQQLRLQMNPNQFWIMGVTVAHGKLSMSEISEFMHMSKQQVTQLVDKMIAKGLLVRQPDQQDRRRVYVVPTEAGWELAQRGQKIVGDTLDERLSRLNQEDCDRLAEALDTINQILAKI